MTIPDYAKEVRKQDRLHKLGSNHPICGTCGETDYRCLDNHHPADYGRDEATAHVCANCHRKVSDEQKDHPAFDPDADVLLDRIAHFLLGLADLLVLAVEKLREFAMALIERASPDPDGEAQS